MKCQQVRDNIKAYVDGELGKLARRRVERHLATCAACRTEEGLMRALTDSVRDTEPATAPAGLREKVLGGIEFTPVSRQLRRLTWMHAAAAFAIFGIAVAVVMPMFGKARESARKSSNIYALTEPARPESGGYFSAARPVAKVPRAVMSPSTKDSSNSDGIQVNLPTKQAPPESTRPGLQIIKTADLIIKVKRFQPAYDDAVRIAASVGGYVTNSSANTEDATPTSGTMTIRVPVTTFDNTVERLGKLGGVKSRSVNGQDVTGDVVDLESRLRNKRAEERQYLDIMNRAKRVPDIVTVTEELSRVRGEIEEMQGQLDTMKHSAAMSTINVTLSENDKPTPKPQSSLRNTFGSAIGSLGDTLGALASGLIWLLVYSPFWALPLAAVFYLRKKYSPAPSE